MKIIIIGGSHAGLAAATYLRELSPDAEITLLEKSASLGFIPSTVNLLFQQYFAETELDAGQTSSVQALRQARIDIQLNTEVLALLTDTKEVLLASEDGQTKKLGYDKLILAMGSEHFEVSLPLSVQKSCELITYKTYEATKSTYQKLKNSSHTIIIGAGFIGLELADSLSRDPLKEVTILERMSSPLFRYFDQEMVTDIIETLPNNVHLKLNMGYYEIQTDEAGQTTLHLEGQEPVAADACVLALNPKPNSDLVSEKLNLAFDKTIVVNEHMQTSNPDIYAVGDLIKIPFMNAETSYYLPQISYARKQSFVAANNIINGNHLVYPESQRTVASEVFGHYIGSCGITQEEAPFYGVHVRSIVREYSSLSNFGELADGTLKIKMVLERQTEQIMGVQLITNKRSVLELINVFSAVIARKDTLMDLLKIDLFFVPRLSPLVSVFSDLMLESELAVN